MVDHFPKSVTHYFTPKEVWSLLPQKRLLKKKRREIEGESEEGKKVIWCEELGKYGGVFIDENGSICYKYH